MDSVFSNGHLQRNFIDAEKCGCWEKNVYIVKSMIPYFHSSGHIHYAKACHIYLQQLNDLEKTMYMMDFDRFVKGYFTIRRKQKFFSGAWTDMIIEQSANKEFTGTGAGQRLHK